ncbi:alpha/beta fold hydrolase [Hymenobacter sediminicola]|uniref:Alpha/beta fold hydrolase n=1 Tax=Hymenobacter sediminicola TaxID=2761579 RepID=A0A7G7W265_9BACT|nr:alpha/beta fold hydrolase [Hymenobacter sediminicola]QNH60458.1 alpha/beta fold hydrolase [Hymenobacter sediminicola]
MQGTVLDEATQQVVPFASVGVAGRPFGTIADEAGHFRFALPDSVQRPVVVSCVGYAAVTLPADQLRTSATVIRLTPAAQQLAAVTVRPGRVRTRTFGRTGNATFMTVRLYTEPGAGQDELAREQGTVVPLASDSYLRTARLLVAFNRFRSVTFRLLLYRVQNGLPTEPLPQPDIRFTVIQPRGWVTVDLEPYQLHYPGLREVAVTVQWLHSEAAPDSANGFAFSAVPLPGHQVLTRSKSQARWETIPGYLGFNLTADTYTAPGKTNGLADTAPNYTLPDSLAYLRYFTAPYLPNPAGYGSNSAAGRYIRVRGARLYYERYGQGEPLLLLHGNGQSGAAFQLQIAELARYFDVLVLDTRAQGHSQDFTTQNFSYELFAEDARQLLDSLHLRRVHILGWSDGGNTALSLALTHPEYVGRLAIMGANLFPAPHALEPALLSGFRRQLQQAQARNTTAIDTRLLRLLVQEPQLTFAQLGQITAPVLVLAGQHDVILEPHTQAIAKALPHSQLVIFPGATHYAPQEIPEVFNATVLRFFRQQ